MGNLVISPQWEVAEDFSEGLAAVCVGECDLEHRRGYRVSKDRTRENIEQNFKYGFIDESGKLIINPVFEDVSHFSDGMAAVCVGRGCYSSLGKSEAEKKWGFIDKTGRFVIAPQFDSADEFKEGLARVSVGGRKGYIDKTGKFVINPQYDQASGFENGIAKVELKITGGTGTKDGYIDKTGSYIWEPSN